MYFDVLPSAHILVFIDELKFKMSTSLFIESNCTSSDIESKKRENFIFINDLARWY